MPPAQAAAATRVTSFTVPSAAVDLEKSPGAVLRAHIVDPVGLSENDPNEPHGELDHVTHLLVRGEGETHPGGYALLGQLVSGTPQDGEWEFQPFQQARAFGDWDAYLLHIARLDGSTSDIQVKSLGFRHVFRTIGRFGAFFDRQSPSSFQDTLIRHGEAITLRGRLYWQDERFRPHPIAGKQLTVLQEDADEPILDGDERQVATGMTAADGTFSIRVVPERNAFRLYVQASKGKSPRGIRYSDASTWTGRVDVQVRIGIVSRPDSLPAGTVGPVEGYVAPRHPGQPAYLQRHTGEGWRTVSTATIRSSGRFTLLAQPPTKGRHSYRVYKASDADHKGYATPAFVITGT